MRVAICVNHFHPSVGGSEYVTKRIAEHIAKSHKVYVFTRMVRGRRADDIKGYQVFSYRHRDASGFLGKLKSVKPDVVLIYSDMFDFYRQVLSGTLKTRLIVALCGANWAHSHPAYSRLFLSLAHNIDHLICHSECERDYSMCSQSFLRDKTVLIPNGIDLSDFDSNIKTREALLPKCSDKQWIINVSNFFPGKGQEHCIEILRLLANKEKISFIQISNDIEFPIGEKLKNSWRLKATRELKQRGIDFHMMSNLPREDVVGFFKNANAFLFPSVKEVAPIVLLESMASRTPWVCMDVGNAKELSGGFCVKAVKDHQFQAMVDSRVIRTMAAYTDRALGEPHLGDVGRLHVEREFMWDKILQLYSNLLER